MESKLLCNKSLHKLPYSNNSGMRILSNTKMLFKYFLFKKEQWLFLYNNRVLQRWRSEKCFSGQWRVLIVVNRGKVKKNYKDGRRSMFGIWVFEAA